MDEEPKVEPEVRPVRKGIIAVTSSVAGSLTGGGVSARWGPLRPQALTEDESRPSQIPSNSTVFGGSCLVASAAAYGTRETTNVRIGVHCNVE